MSTTTAARDHLAKLIELKAAIAEILIKTMYPARIRHAQICAANTEAEIEPFINGGATKPAQPTTGTDPCK